MHPPNLFLHCLGGYWLTVITHVPVRSETISYDLLVCASDPPHIWVCACRFSLCCSTPPCSDSKSKVGTGSHVLCVQVREMTCGPCRRTLIMPTTAKVWVAEPPTSLCMTLPVCCRQNSKKSTIPSPPLRPFYIHHCCLPPPCAPHQELSIHPSLVDVRP